MAASVDDCTECWFPSTGTTWASLARFSNAGCLVVSGGGVSEFMSVCVHETEG